MSESLAKIGAEAYSAPGKIRMTYEEYLAWATEDVHAEWVDGEVIVQMPPKDPHQELVSFLTMLLGLYNEIFELGRVWTAPFEVKLWPEGPSREPDVLFLSKEHLNRLTPERINGAPDLIIEVLSDDSVHRDRVDKRDEYERAGVPEYWILDNRPMRSRALFHQLDELGRYREIQPEADGTYRSKVLPGFRIRVGTLFEPNPSALGAIAEILGPDRLAEAMKKALAATKR